MTLNEQINANPKLVAKLKKAAANLSAPMSFDEMKAHILSFAPKAN